MIFTNWVNVARVTHDKRACVDISRNPSLVEHISGQTIRHAHLREHVLGHNFQVCSAVAVLDQISE